MDSGFRQLTDRERGLLEKLLEADFLGRDELRTQLGSVTAKQIEEDGTLSLQCDSGTSSPGKFALAAEGTCKDADGGSMSVMLHLNRDGFMTMLEIIKYGTAPIIIPPSGDDLALLLPEARGRKEEHI
jgi:hypothetical protein